MDFSITQLGCNLGDSNLLGLFKIGFWFQLIQQTGASPNSKSLSNLKILIGWNCSDFKCHGMRSWLEISKFWREKALKGSHYCWLNIEKNQESKCVYWVFPKTRERLVSFILLYQAISSVFLSFIIRVEFVVLTLWIIRIGVSVATIWFGDTGGSWSYTSWYYYVLEWRYFPNER